MKSKFRIKKKYIILGSVALFLFLLLFFLSDFARWYMVKHGKELTGRKIDLGSLHINYLDCSVKAGNFVMYEANDRDTFVSFREFYVNFDPWNLLHSEYAFSEIRLTQPVVSVIYADSLFNFSDLIKSSDTTREDTLKNESNDTVRYLVKNLKISGGYIRYEDKNTKNITELRDFGVSVPEISWNSRQSKMGVDFTLGREGKVSLGGVVSQASNSFAVTLKTQNIEIAPYTGYLKPYLAISLAGGRLYSDLLFSGPMSDPLKMKITGEAGLKNFMIKDAAGKDVCSANDINVKIDTLDIGKSDFAIQKLTLDHLKLVAVLDRSGTNIEKLIVPQPPDTTGPTDTTAVHYSIGEVAIKQGNIDFSDLTLNRPFKYNIGNIDITVKEFSDLSNKIPIAFNMLLNHSGQLKGDAVMDMADLRNVQFKGSLSNVELLSFSPYSEYWLARPITKGTFNYQCDLFMNPMKLDNLNGIRIKNLSFGKKTKDTTAYRLPMALALYILKDRQGMIKADIPVSGNPSNPNFKLRKIIWKTVEEFLLKIITEPFKAIGNMFGTNPEAIKQIPFELGQDSLSADEQQKLEKIAEIIVQKPELSFTFTQTTDPEKEKDLIAANAAKYLFLSKTAGTGTTPDVLSQQAAALNDKDAAFLTFLGIGSDSLANQFALRCRQMAGAETVEDRFAQLLAKRQQAFQAWFAAKSLPEGSVLVKTADMHNLPEEMKVPKFVVEVGVK